MRYSTESNYIIPKKQQQKTQQEFLHFTLKSEISHSGAATVNYNGPDYF